ALDLMVANFRGEASTVYCRGPLGFRDRTGALGVTALTRPFTGFGLVALDLDGDGVDELIQINGRVTQLEEARGKLPPSFPSKPDAVREFWDAYAERSQILTRHGNQYEDVSAQ